ncbi:BTAD domain-containing putative transcriptional regulator [Salinispora arenicola]|uniref:AfsR/SARP family transcriptional regulator n=1 Tax=Salinispora arenicola TaxID=168697 RepID=UPI00036411E9
MTSFLVLGTIEARTRTTVQRITGVMKQTLLAALIAANNRPVTIEALSEELWGPTPPAKMENALQAQVSRIRRLLNRLEPERPESRLITTVSSYRMMVSWSEVDVLSFERTVNVIQDRPCTDLRRDIRDLRSALELWRGPIFGGLTGGAICQAAAARYQQIRTTALELLYDRELRNGNQARIIPELMGLMAESPTSEQLCSLLMVALYRSGRQAEALEVYRHLRRHLADELGMETSPVLRRYEKAILDHDPLLFQQAALPVFSKGD